MPLNSTSIKNGSRHRVRPLHGGNGKTPGTPGAQLNSESQGRGKQSLGKERRDPLLMVLCRKLSEDGFHEFNSFLLQMDRLQLTAVYCNRRRV